MAPYVSLCRIADLENAKTHRFKRLNVRFARVEANLASDSSSVQMGAPFYLPVVVFEFLQSWRGHSSNI